MTKPSLDSSFDTSLVDSKLKQSFSSGTTISSASTTADPVISTGTMKTLPQSTRPFRDLSTSATYEAWADTYDSDGNILQAVDDICLSTLLSTFLSRLQPTPPRPLTIVDLGCGTGRNTLPLLDHPWSQQQQSVTIHGIDASSAMLAHARTKCSAHLSQLPPEARSAILDLHLSELDIFTPRCVPASHHNIADAVISTLVLEHIPLSTFFASLHTLLREGGMALVTNMHPDMGARTQAGFVSASGERVRGTSFVYGVQETVDAAVAAGFEVVGEVREQAVEEGMLGRIGRRGAKWVDVRVWYGIVMRKRVASES